MTLVSTCAALALLLAACHPDHSGNTEVPRSDQMFGGGIAPRSHQIPPGHEAEVRKLFESNNVSYPISVVSSAGTNTQFVNPKPAYIGTDRFVIGATPEIHAELDQLLAAMAKMPAPPATSTYAMTYWAIEADPSADSQIPPDLSEIAPVLQSLAGLGPRHFKTIDRVAAHVLDGFRADVKGRELSVEQTLSVDPSALELGLRLELRGHRDEPSTSVDTKLQLAVDKPIVLGQTSIAAGSDTSAGVVLYVVRAQRAQ
jgi:hypothetical protein